MIVWTSSTCRCACSRHADCFRKMFSRWKRFCCDASNDVVKVAQCCLCTDAPRGGCCARSSARVFDCSTLCLPFLARAESSLALSVNGSGVLDCSTGAERSQSSTASSRIGFDRVWASNRSSDGGCFLAMLRSGMRCSTDFLLHRHRLQRPRYPRTLPAAQFRRVAMFSTLSE